MDGPHIRDLSRYTIPEPRPPVALYVLGALVLVGLVGLFLAAYAAFSVVTQTQLQALFFAALIEAGLVAEGLAFIRQNELNLIAVVSLAGLVVSLAVSGTYNWIQVQSLAGDLAAWPVLALALGPLSAFLFVVLAFGRELAAAESARVRWAQTRQAWVEGEIRRQEERVRLERVRLERRAARRETAARKHEIKLAQAQAEPARPEPNPSGNGARPFREWGDIPEEVVHQMATMTGSQIETEFHVPRTTAQGWRRRARESAEIRRVEE